HSCGVASETQAFERRGPQVLAREKGLPLRQRSCVRHVEVVGRETLLIDDAVQLSARRELQGTGVTIGCGQKHRDHVRIEERQRENGEPPGAAVTVAVFLVPNGISERAHYALV